MGLFGLFGSKEEREKSALRKLAKRLTERYGPPENRQKAIAQLGEMGTPEALETLCLRFTVRVEPGITDDEEKETTRSILVEARDDGVEPIERFVTGHDDGIAWGLRVLAEVAPAEKVRAVVLRELSRLGGIYTRDPDKKLVLLKWLAEHHAGAGGPEVEAALLPLLEDFSDDVRISTTRALAALAPGEAARDGLIALLLRDRDNARVRGEVLDALATLGADVKGHRPSVEALLVEPFFLDREGRVKKRV
jgi:HEAT repeat protein